MLGSQFVYIGVLSDDFAAVDVREELCYHSRPKKTNSEGWKRHLFKADDYPEEIAGKK